MYLNKVYLIGNLTRDPELKSLPSGTKVTNFSIATNRYWKDAKTGEKKEQSEFHNIVVFGPQAETSAKYLKKGSNVLIEGRIQTRSWDATDGTKKYRTEVIAESVQFGNTRSAGGEGGGYQASQNQGSSPVKQQSANSEQSDVIEYPDEDINPEDIPF